MARTLTGVAGLSARPYPCSRRNRVRLAALCGLEAPRGVPGLDITVGRASEGGRQAHSPLRVERALCFVHDFWFLRHAFCFWCVAIPETIFGLGSNPENAQVLQLSLRTATPNTHSPLSITMCSPLNAKRTAHRVARQLSSSSSASSSAQDILRMSDNLRVAAQFKTVCKVALIPVFAKHIVRRHVH